MLVFMLNLLMFVKHSQLPPPPKEAPLPTSSLGAEALRVGRGRSDEQLDALADGLPADGAGLESRAAVHTGGVSTLKDKLDVVVDADGAGDPLLHLPVARLQLLQQVVLLRVLGAGAAVHLCLVCGRRERLVVIATVCDAHAATRLIDPRFKMCQRFFEMLRN